MATQSDRLSENAAGAYYVDSSCIDCDQCRVMAPDIFARSENGFSFVKRQPATSEEAALVEEAMNSCATASIGKEGA